MRSIVTHVEYFHRVRREPAIHSSLFAYNAKDSYESFDHTRRRTVSRESLARELLLQRDDSLVGLLFETKIAFGEDAAEFA